MVAALYETLAVPLASVVATELLRVPLAAGTLALKVKATVVATGLPAASLMVTVIVDVVRPSAGMLVGEAATTHWLRGV